MNTVVSFGQTATIGSVEALRADLLAAFQDGSDLVLDTGDLADVDLAGVQLIEAARQHAQQAGGTIRLAAPANPALTHLLGRAGLIDGATQDDLAFWFHGERPQ